MVVVAGLTLWFLAMALGWNLAPMRYDFRPTATPAHPTLVVLGG